MDSQILRPKELACVPNSPDAPKIFKFWLRTVKNFIANLEETSSKTANKIRVLISCLSPNVYPLIEDVDTYEKIVDILYHSILPLTAYVAGSFAVLTFMMKTSLMENLAADYVRTAIAKGVPFKRAVVTHAIRNSLIPLATHFGQIITVFLGGSFLIEKIFNIDGLGLLGYESIVERDYPVVLGTLVISSLATLLGNILSDVCVALVDPRVQFK